MRDWIACCARSFDARSAGAMLFRLMEALIATVVKAR
jgi:hypothetical protein